MSNAAQNVDTDAVGDCCSQILGMLGGEGD